MIKHLNCDVFDSDVDVIIQQNNCFQTHGAGIAKLIKDKFPEVYKNDLKTGRGDKTKKDEILAAKKYDEMAKQLFGNKAYINFSNE